MKILNFTLFLVYSIYFVGCYQNGSDPVSNRYSAKVQPTAANTLEERSNDKQTNPDEDKDSFECVRAEPEAIIRKNVFPNTTFRLEKNKEFPYQNLGYETVEFENGDRLLIENIGCENFTLVFHFETSRFSHDINDARFWYKTAAGLIAKTDKGIRKPFSVKRGLNALNSYIKNTKNLKYKHYIDYCERGSEIGCYVSLDEVKKQENNAVEVVISFGIGPL